MGIFFKPNTIDKIVIFIIMITTVSHLSFMLSAFWYSPYSLIFRIAYGKGSYYDEEVHLPGDSKQPGNEENVDENNSIYF